MWSLIETDFSSDETANFGPREEKGTALYQIDTMATVSCTDPDNTRLPTVASSVLGDLTCLAVHKHLLQQTETLIAFDNELETLDWSPDGTLLAVGDSAGILYILSAETKEIIFSYNLVSETMRVDGRSFRKIQFSAAGDLLILTADGQLYVQSGVEAFQEGNETNMSELMENNIAMVETSSQHSRTYDVVTMGDYIYTLGEGRSVISAWRVKEGSIQLLDEVESCLDEAGARQGLGTLDGNYLFVLDSNNMLKLWNAKSLTCVRQWTEFSVAEFCLLETNTSQSSSGSGMMAGIKLVLLTVPEGGVCYLKVQSLPDFQTVYQLQLHAHSQLAKCNSMQEGLYISEFCPNTEKPGTVSSMRFRCLSETDPETRLYRILQKNKFEEAEEFANVFHLDKELVYTVKANYLIDQLSPWNVDKHAESQVTAMMNEMWNCLNTIEDDLYVAENCMAASLPTLESIQDLLVYCRKRLEKVSSGRDAAAQNEKRQGLMKQLLQIQHRFFTFKLAFSEQEFSGERWDLFKRANLLKEALEQIQRGHLDTGFIIWIQHQADWKHPVFTADIVQKVLASILSDTPYTSLQCYLATGLMPVTVREVPEALDSIVTFIVDKTKSMERVEKKSWPKNAITFASHMYNQLCDLTDVTLDENTCITMENANKALLKFETVLEPLQTLISQLQQLDVLLHKYKCRLTLTQFLQETCETIAFRMLDKVIALQLIGPTLEKQIQPYMKEHCLHQDVIFSKYIKDLLERWGRIACYTYKETPWEAKACAIIRCISDPEQKIEGILEVTKRAPIPWSTQIDELVQSGLTLKHPKVSKLKDCYKLLHVHKLLLNYGLRNVEVPQGPEAMRLVYMILQKATHGCLGDALEVMKACGVKLEHSVHSFHMRQLIKAGKLDEAADLIQSLPVTDGVPLGNSILTLAFVVINTTVDFGEQEQQKYFTEAGIYCSRYLQKHIDDVLKRQELEEQERLLRSVFALQVEFGQFLTIDQYRDNDYRLQLIQDYVLKFYTKDKQTMKYAKVYRLADILQVPHATILGQLVTRSAVAGDIKAVVRFARELSETSWREECADTLYEVTQALLKLLAETEDEDEGDFSCLRLLPDICDLLARKAICVCQSDEIGKFMELYKSCSLLTSVSLECETYDGSLLSSWGTFDPSSDDHNINLSPGSVQEDAMLLNSTVALPMVAKYTLVSPLLTADKGNDDTDVAEEPEEASVASSQCNAVLPVVHHLKENGHLQLALRFSIHMLYTVAEHTLKQDMGLPLYAQDQIERVKLEKVCLTELNQKSQSLLRDLVTNIVMKIFNNAKTDEQLGLAYLSCRPRKDIHDTMMRLTKSAGQMYKKLQAVARMGVALGELLRDSDLVSMCQQLELNANWGYRLGKMKIAFKGALFCPKSEKQKLLPAIAQNEAADAGLVRDFCRSFELGEDEALLMYVDHLLVLDETGPKKSSVLAKAREAMAGIKNTDQLRQRIKKIFYRTSSYDYETLGFLLEEMGKCEDVADIPVEKGLKLLEYLRVYTRRAEPSDYEFEYKSGRETKETLQLMMGSLPASSKTRLPFHPLLQGEPWKIITAELNKETISVWLLIGKLLCVSQDQICASAVQNMVRSYADTFTSVDGGSDMTLWNWSLDLANKQLLSDIKSVLNLITNCDISLACAKWMVNKLPLGSEKVLVLKACTDLAELWYRGLPENSADKKRAETAYIKFVKHWQKMASAQALCLHGLGEEELLQLTDRPSLLIQRLYEHDSITRTSSGSTGLKKPDIHSAAESLAEINNLDLNTIQTALVRKWLQSSTSQTEAEVTMTFNLENLKMADDATVDDHSNNEEVIFKRVVHLVRQEQLEEKALLLLEFAFNENEENEMVCSIRALRCLLHLCDNKQLQEMYSKSAQETSQLMHIMQYLVRLEKLHIRHSVETFQCCNKEGLVRGIWRNHSHEKTAVPLVSCLCLDYGLFDAQLWNSILTKLHSYGLLKQLEYVLLRLGSVSTLWTVPAFPKTWQLLISTTLEKVSLPLDADQFFKTVHYFNLLLRCPVIGQLDINSLSQLYAKLELWSCAVGCLLLTGQGVAQVLQQAGSRRVLDSADALLRHGLNQRVVHQVKASVYHYVLATEKFDEILDTPHQQDFILTCVKEGKVNSLLVFALKSNRLDEAKQLFGLYLARNPDILMKLQQYMYVMEEEEMGDDLLQLKAYLKMSDLREVEMLLS